MNHADFEPIITKLRRNALATLQEHVQASTLGELEAARRRRLAGARRRPENPSERKALLRQEETERLQFELDGATEPLARHFIYNQLEECLYKSRGDDQASLLECERVSERHHSEIDAIRRAFLKESGDIPNIPMYRQMAIMKYKSRDFVGALKWAERGIAVYGSRAVSERVVKDLKDRATRYRSQVAHGDRGDQH